MSHDRESEGWIKKHAGRNMGYIWCVGVSVQARGRGYSRALIDESIDQMRLLGLNECWLKTEDPKNVTIYEKLGFTLMNHMVVKSSSIDSWAMRKMI
jgi:ribosomal protein S18 acetylase RimI-like enzyme